MPQQPCACFRGTSSHAKNYKGVFGFIKPNDGGGELFCDIKGLRHGNGSVADGDSVKFKRCYDYQKKKDYAVEVTSYL